MPHGFRAAPPGTPLELRTAWLAQQLGLELDPEVHNVRRAVDMVSNLDGLPDKKAKATINEMRKRVMSSLLPHLGLQRGADGSVSFALCVLEGVTFSVTDIADLAGVEQAPVEAV